MGQDICHRPRSEVRWWQATGPGLQDLGTLLGPAHGRDAQGKGAHSCWLLSPRSLAGGSRPNCLASLGRLWHPQRGDSLPSDKEWGRGSSVHAPRSSEGAAITSSHPFPARLLRGSSRRLTGAPTSTRCANGHHDAWVAPWETVQQSSSEAAKLRFLQLLFHSRWAPG